jgi:hypothetical protein
MNKTITQEELKKLEGFIGYGKPDADIIFFGLEEAGGGKENLIKRLSITDYKYLDCRRFHIDHLEHKKPYKLHSDDEDKMVKFQSVWRYMSYIMLKLEGKSNNEIFEDNFKILRKYQNNFLGSEGVKGNSLLTEIYPIPCSSLKLWGTKKVNYKELIPQYPDKKTYKKEVLPKRVIAFKELMNSNKFQARSIICYGKTNWPEFKSFFKELEVQFEKLQLSKPAEKGIIPNGTAVYLLPFFGNGRVSYEFLEEVVKDINR